MALAELSWRLTKDLAIYGVNRIREKLGANIPTQDVIRSFRPEHTVDPKDPHGDSHIARTQVITAGLVRIQFAHDPNIVFIERCTLEALKWHDIRQGREENNGNHALEAAVEFATHPATSQFTIAERNLIIALIYYHSGLEDPTSLKGETKFLDILHTMQDADASDLGRLTLSKPVRAEDIFLRTQEAKKFYLPHVAQRIERVSRLMTTTDAYEAQLQAAQFLGLLR